VNLVDVGILAVVVLCGFLGLLRGAVREVMALGSLLLGTLVALYGYADLARPLGRWIHDPLLAQAAGFFGILLLVWIVFALAGSILRRLVRFLRLGFADRIGGLAFGPRGASSCRSWVVLRRVPDRAPALGRIEDLGLHPGRGRRDPGGLSSRLPQALHGRGAIGAIPARGGAAGRGGRNGEKRMRAARQAFFPWRTDPKIWCIWTSPPV
jgi:hypothetical protein